MLLYSVKLTIKILWFLLSLRTNSDSALHQSTMTPAQQESFSGGSQDMQQKRGEQKKKKDKKIYNNEMPMDWAPSVCKIQEC